MPRKPQITMTQDELDEIVEMRVEAELEARRRRGAEPAGDGAGVVLQAEREPGKSDDQVVAEKVLRVGTMSAIGMQHAFGLVKAVAAAEVLKQRANDVAKGDMSYLESLLTTQAIALDQTFNNYLARTQGVSSTDLLERLLRIAFKAQSQCRTTVESLGMLKNPPVFARQANINHGGQQQVNNGPTTNVAGARAEAAPGVNEVKEIGHVVRLDSGAASGAIGPNPRAAAVEEVDRATHATRQGQVVQERARARPASRDRRHTKAAQ